VIRIGCAGWSLPKRHRDVFPEMGSHLQRYASRFNCVEINSSFYRPHRETTYARWAASVPADFQFAVKMPLVMTHDRRLVDVDRELAAFLSQIAAMGPNLGPVLIQLPPSFAFEQDVAQIFFADLRARFAGDVVCEPRHRTWFSETAGAILADHRIARVAADPAITPRAATPGGWDGLAYLRLHGTPQIYYSSYPPDSLGTLADRLTRLADIGTPCWCIFDNTALGAATENALHLQERLKSQPLPTQDTNHPTRVTPPPA
jgi:uncharacterized protein YecE (DUF72 family)